MENGEIEVLREQHNGMLQQVARPCELPMCRGRYPRSTRCCSSSSRLESSFAVGNHLPSDANKIRGRYRWWIVIPLLSASAKCSYNTVEIRRLECRTARAETAVR